MDKPITLDHPAGLKTRAVMAFDKVNNASYRMKCTLFAGAATVMMITAPTLCAADMDSIVLTLLDFVFSLARIVGIVIAVNGVFNWVLANKDENADGQSRGIKFVVCGLALVFLKDLADPIITAVGF